MMKKKKQQLNLSHLQKYSCWAGTGGFGGFHRCSLCKKLELGGVNKLTLAAGWRAGDKTLRICSRKRRADTRSSQLKSAKGVYPRKCTGGTVSFHFSRRTNRSFLVRMVAERG